MMKTTILAEYSGSQARSYGPTVWSGTITYEMDGRPISGNEGMVRQLLSGFVYFVDPDEKTHWFVPVLEKLELVDNVWHYRVERPYDD